MARSTHVQPVANPCQCHGRLPPQALGKPHFPSVSLGAARQVWHAPPELSARILNSKLPGHPAGQLAWSLNPRQAPSQELVKISGSDPATASPAPSGSICYSSLFPFSA